MMKTKSTLLAFGITWLLATIAVRAQSTNGSTNALPLNQTLRYQVAVENDRALGEHAILPPGLKEKMRLTDQQRTELKPIEADFYKTSEQYQAANQPRIDAALEANQLARLSKSPERILAARKQLQAVWAGLQPDRATAVRLVKPLLTPEQLTILEDPKNQWHESHGAEVNDPSAN
jgi:hypothetical protein